MGGRRNSQTKQQQDADAESFLQELIEAGPQTPSSWRPAVALRSVDEQRRHALGHYSFRTWFDHTLKYIERILIILGLLFFGYWLYDGPIRDWLYIRSLPVAQQARAADAQGIAATRATQQLAGSVQNNQGIQAAPLPYITDSMLQDSNDDFLAPGLSLVPAAIHRSSTPERLLIPSIGVDTPVKEVFVVDGTWQVADYAAGYMHGTALPGEKGTMAFAGHAGLRGAVFRDLPAMTLNDNIFVEADGWRYRYQVSRFEEVWPTQTEVLAGTPNPTLILMTCTNWDTQRFIVYATLMESKPLASP